MLDVKSSGEELSCEEMSKDEKLSDDEKSEIPNNDPLMT